MGSGTREALESGSIIYAMTQSESCVPLAFARLYDTLVGGTYSDAPEQAEIINTNEYLISSVEDYDNLMKYAKGDFGVGEDLPCLTAEEMKNMMASYNPDASYAAFVGFAESQTLDDLLSRRQ